MLPTACKCPEDKEINLEDNASLCLIYKSSSSIGMDAPFMEIHENPEIAQ